MTTRSEEETKTRRAAFEEQLKFYKNANRDRERGRIGRGVGLLITSLIIVGYIVSNWNALLGTTAMQITYNGTTIGKTPLADIPVLALALGAAALFCFIFGCILLGDE